MALLVGAFPQACVWPCEAAGREEEGEMRESAGGCPWLSDSMMGGGLWCQEAKELGSGKHQRLDSLGISVSCNKPQGSVIS